MQYTGKPLYHCAVATFPLHFCLKPFKHCTKKTILCLAKLLNNTIIFTANMKLIFLLTISSIANGFYLPGIAPVNYCETKSNICKVSYNGSF